VYDFMTGYRANRTGTVKARFNELKIQTDIKWPFFGGGNDFLFVFRSWIVHESSSLICFFGFFAHAKNHCARLIFGQCLEQP